LGDWLTEPADQVEAWERITGPLPASIARRLNWALANEERQQAVEAAGHRVCSEVERILAPATPGDVKEALARYERVEAHMTTCPVCQARKSFLDTLPPLPSPLSTWDRLRSPLDSLVALADWAEQRPTWLRRGLYGAGIVYAFFIDRGGVLGILIALLLILVTGHGTEIWRLLLVILVVAPAGGFLGGLLYSVCDPLAEHLGVVGRFLQRVAGGIGYALVLVYAVLPLMPDESVGTTRGYSTFFNLAFVGIFGLLIGATLTAVDGTPAGVPQQTSWRFVAGAVLVGGFLLLLMRLAGWW
jgi:hypothetical protein